VAAVAAALGLGWWGASQLAVRNDPCEQAAARIDEGWPPALRERVAAAIAEGADDPGYAQRVVAAIDAHVDELREQRLSACRSDASGEPGAREDAAVRIACLDRAHAHLEALIGTFEQPSESRAASALPAVAQLPAPDECGDAAALRRSMPMPDDPLLAAEVMQLRIDLGAVSSRFAAGDTAGANALAQSLLVRARALGYEPVLAEALVDTARAALALADADRAIASAEESYRLAERHGVDVVTANALGVLTIVYTILRPEPELATWLSTQHEALVHRLGDPPGRLSWVLANRARLRRQAGELAEATVLLEQAEAVLAAAGIEDSDRVATLDNLGSAYSGADRNDEALATYERAFAMAELALGPGHQLRVNVMLHLAQERWHRGDHGRGLTLFYRTLAGARRTYSASHPNLVAVLNSVGVVMLELDPNEAHRLLQEAFDDASAQGNVPDILRNNLAHAYLRLGRHDDAIALHRELLAGKDIAAKDRAHWHVEIADDLLAAGKPDEALRELDAGRVVLAGATPALPDTPELLVTTARVQLAQGDRVAALATARRALAVHEQSDASPDALARTRYTLARALRANGVEPAVQQVLVRAALQAWARDAPSRGPELAAALAFELGDAPPL
jgi:tetratricopeptide (TPR) repeat protein